MWELMWDEDHREGQKELGVDPRGRPEIIGIIVLMHAMQTIKFKGGEDEEGLVAKYAEHMLEQWESSRDMMKLDKDDWWDANYKLWIWSPTWQALRLAQQVISSSPSLVRTLDQKLHQDLLPLLQKAQPVISARPLKAKEEEEEPSPPTPSAEPSSSEGNAEESEPETLRPRGLKMYELMVQLSS